MAYSGPRNVEVPAYISVLVAVWAFNWDAKAVPSDLKTDSDRLGTDLGQILDHLGIILEPFWDHFSDKHVS